MKLQFLTLRSSILNKKKKNEASTHNVVPRTVLFISISMLSNVAELYQHEKTQISINETNI